MNRRQFFRFGISAPLAAAPLFRSSSAEAAALAQQPSALPPPGVDGWISLFNGRDLTGWYTFLQRSGKDVAQKNGYVTVENGLLHIMGTSVTTEAAESGYLATNQEFENVRIRVEYKWGIKRFAPRLENKRDNGLLYYVVGRDVVWPTCVECQIQETDTGDVFLLGNTRAVQGGLPGNGGSGFITLVRGAAPGAGAGAGRAAGAGTGAAGAGAPAGPAPVAGGAAPAAGGAPAGGRGGGAPAGGRGGGPPAVEPSGGRKLKDGDFENLDDWNVVEVIAQGNRATQLVNGRIVNILTNIQQPDTANAGQFLPLTKGKIGIEIEFAEIWYRRIEVKPL
jgi:hypothetical protein